MIGPLSLCSRLPLVGLALCAALIGCTPSGDGDGNTGESSQGANLVKDWSKDDRVAPVLYKCAGQGRFERDTSDMLPILVEKLQNAQLETLRNVREELARMGEPAIVELDRVVRRVYSDIHSSAIVINALGVINNSDAGSGELAQSLLSYCLGHPQETIRSAAIRALTKHAQPGVYDDLLAILRISHDIAGGLVVTALYTADSRRFERDFASWLVEDSQRGVRLISARLVAQGADAETAKLFGPLSELAKSTATKAFLLAIQDKAEPDDSQDQVPGMAELIAMLESEVRDERVQAMAALEYTSATDAVAHVLKFGTDQPLRMMACSLLGVRTDDPAAIAALRIGLNDDDVHMRENCMRLLLVGGDERAADLAIGMFQNGNQQEVGIATRALLNCWDENPGQSKSALKVLIKRFDARSTEGYEESLYLIQAIAQIPGPQSTEWLINQGNVFGAAGGGARAQNYFITQASNTALAGQEYLREEWRQEEDLERRFDLLWSATLGHDDPTRQFLIEVLGAKRSAPHELLYAAERLAREGPASLVAPLIKRVNLRMSDPTFRPAMECLLWRWYG
ncbi:MAG: hypothetical protein ACI8X5_004263 [Planctomycetota bacterium]